MAVKLISSQHHEHLTKNWTKSRLLLNGKHLFFDREDVYQNPGTSGIYREHQKASTQITSEI